jgi:hypothetical protein
MVVVEHVGFASVYNIVEGVSGVSGGCGFVGDVGLQEGCVCGSYDMGFRVKAGLFLGVPVQKW